MDHIKAMEMIGQMAVKIYLERVTQSDAHMIRLMEPYNETSELPGPLAYNFVFPRDLRVFIQYADIAQFVN